MEILKIFKYNLEESQLLELKEVLSHYFMSKIDSEMDKIWNENERHNTTLETISYRHTRTPYKI